MKFISRKRWNYSINFIDTKSYRLSHPKELHHLSGLEQYVVLKYLQKMDWAVSISVELYPRHPDIYIVEGLSDQYKVLTWIKPIQNRTNRLSSLENKYLLKLADEQQCFPGFILIRIRPIRIIEWVSLKKYECYFVAISNLFMF